MVFPLSIFPNIIIITADNGVILTSSILSMSTDRFLNFMCVCFSDHSEVQGCYLSPLFISCHRLHQQVQIHSHFDGQLFWCQFSQTIILLKNNEMVCLFYSMYMKPFVVIVLVFQCILFIFNMLTHVDL